MGFDFLKFIDNNIARGKELQITKFYNLFDKYIVKQNGQLTWKSDHFGWIEVKFSGIIKAISYDNGEYFVYNVEFRDGLFYSINQISDEEFFYDTKNCI